MVQLGVKRVDRLIAMSVLGSLLMVWNLWQTVNAKHSEPAATPALVPAE